MNITDILDACETTYRIEYRDQAKTSTWWTSWRSLVNAQYLDTEHFLPHIAYHLTHLTRQQAEVRLRVARMKLDKDIDDNIRYELRAIPDP